jgi:type VI secretion system secreted protein VgrG
MRLTILGSNAHWRILTVTGEEALSEPYSFSITASHAADPSTQAHELERELLGAPVSFAMYDGDILRYGLVASVEVLGQSRDGEQVNVRVEVRPRVWLLGLRRNTRIFQAMYPHQIVSQVLTESGVPHRWSLQNTYPKRVYCTQYQETDLEFVERLLAEEGVYYYFDHDRTFTPDIASGAPGDPVGTAAGYVSGVAAAAAAIAPNTQSSSTGLSGGLAAGGGLVGIVGEAMTPQTDPEADSPIVPSTGKGGPNAKDCEVFVFADTRAGYSQALLDDDGPGSPNLTVTHRPWAAADLDHFSITSFLPTRTIRPGKVELRDYNFRRPLLQHRAALPTRGAAEPAAGAVFPAPLEIYEHHGEYEKPDVSAQQAENVLEQYRSRSAVVAGQGMCARMLPGYALVLTQAPALFRDGAYVPVRVHHEAHDRFDEDARGEAKTVDAVAAALHATLHRQRAAGEQELRDIVRDAMERAPFPVRGYQNRFEWVTSEVVFRPPRPRRIRDAVNESAVVVGPPGQATYQDKYGRVKVQFQWDREGRYDDGSSCWVRVAQPWAGAGYGFQFIPRMGMEVIVTFLGGDPDRPIVMGSVYNTTHPTPEPLPERMTRSGIRTQTIPGGNGFNEISFEDEQGVERVYIHAEKDLMAVVNDGHIVNVKGDETTTVSGKQQVAVGDKSIHAVGGDTIDLGGGNHTEQVAGNHIHRIMLDRREQVQGSATLEVKGVAVSQIEGDDVKVVRGNQALAVHGNLNVNVGGLNQDSKGCVMTHVQGSTYLVSTERVVIMTGPGSPEKMSIRLVCGDSFLEMKKDCIELQSKSIKINGQNADASDGTIELTAAANIVAWGKTSTRVAGGSDTQTTLEVKKQGCTLGGGDTVTISTKQNSILDFDHDAAKLYGPSGVQVLGSSISLKSGSDSADPISLSSQSQTDQPPTQPLKLLFTHTAKSIGEPIKSARYHLLATAAESQLEASGQTGGDGSIQVDLPPTTKTVHVTVFINELTDFADVYDTPLEWNLHIVDDLGTANALAGARMRLQNLGYSPGTDTTITDIANDPATAAALTAFQRQFGLLPDGTLDTRPTKNTLDQVYSRTYVDPPPPPSS